MMNKARKPDPVDDRHSARPALLTTWILWRNLLHPHDPPLFRRTLRLSPENTALSQTTLLWIAPLLSAGACCGVLPLNASIAIFLPVALMTFSSTYMLFWVERISSTISRERERGSYEQLSLTPAGALGTSWALTAATLHHSDALGWIDLIRKLLALLLLIALLTILVTTTLRQDIAMRSQFWLLLIEMTTLVAVFYADHVQTIVLGSLVAMLAAAHASTVLDASVWAALLFLALQAIICLATMLTPTVLLPTLTSLAAELQLDLTVSPLDCQPGRLLWFTRRHDYTRLAIAGASVEWQSG